ncbi:MAG: hypothetical protein CMP58_01870 [Flavobacteriales bacterium]|nr:hypothetical protein [Flavobacteriales bacterium]|tara:strand:- start:225 stop:608 length:384 start_codon:yes stop_codon:yes gene_type:complete
MKDKLNKVKLFHEKFGIKNMFEPVNVLEEVYNLRFSLMKEENEEYLQACKSGDLVEVADALGDQLYILCGTILSHGLQDVIDEVFNEIQDSNMSKLGSDGKPIYREDGKILKGANYFKPDINKILKK